MNFFFNEEIAKLHHQTNQLRELRELLTEPRNVQPEPERTETEELRAQLQHQATILQRIVEDAVPVDGFTRPKYELILDAETLASIRTASRYPATLPPPIVAATNPEEDGGTDEGCPF